MTMTRIRCDCILCLGDDGYQGSQVSQSEYFYWAQRRLAPHKFDGRAQPILRKQLHPGDCFEYVDAEQYVTGPVYVKYEGRAVVFPSLWSSSDSEPPWPDAEVRMIRHDDPRCSCFWNDVNWPHYGSSYAVAARLASMPLPEIDISKEAVW